MPTTPARYSALKWFFDHETLGPDEMLTRKPPSARMRRLMAREGQVERQPLGQFEYQKWLLTAQGRAVLAAKPPPRRSRSMPDANSPKRTQSGGKSARENLG
jgi:hypothetical protein